MFPCANFPPSYFPLFVLPLFMRSCFFRLIFPLANTIWHPPSSSLRYLKVLFIFFFPSVSNEALPPPFPMAWPRSVSLVPPLLTFTRHICRPSPQFSSGLGDSGPLSFPGICFTEFSSSPPFPDILSPPPVRPNFQTFFPLFSFVRI